jgi:hypothetical protein
VNKQTFLDGLRRERYEWIHAARNPANDRELCVRRARKVNWKIVKAKRA